MAKSIMIGPYGTAGVAPTTASINWNSAIVKDEIVLELFEGLTIGELEILTNTPQIDTELQLMEVEGYNNIFVKLVMINLEPTSPIAARQFIITIRHIDTAVVFGTLTIKYTDTYNKIGITNSVFKQWCTNNNYGNGTTSIAVDKIIPFTRVPFTYTSILGSDIINDSSIITSDPRGQLSSNKPSVLTVAYGSKATVQQEGQKQVTNYKDTWKTVKEGIAIIHKEPVIWSNNKAKAGSNSSYIAIVKNMDTTTSNTQATTNLLWGSTHTIILDKTYYGMEQDFSIHPECVKGVDKISAKWDNQQSDIVIIYPYVYKGQFQCKVQPLKNVTRAALVGVQLHNAHAWDNGQYLTKVMRFDLKAGTNTTPIDLLEKEITVKVGEVEPYRVFTPSGEYRYTIDKPELCSVDQNSSTVTGLSPGVAMVTFTSKYSNLTEGSITLKVTVVPIPDPSITVNRKVVIVAVGDSAGITITATKADILNMTQDPDGHVRIYDYTTVNNIESTVSGRINFRGLKEGITLVSITSKYKGVTQLTEVIEVHVIPRGTYKIIASPVKVKIDIKKNRYPDKKPVMFWATTNAKYIKYEYNTEQESYFVEGTPVFTDMTLKFWPKTQRGKYTFTVYGHMLDPQKRVVSLDIPVTVTKNAAVPKDQIWVSVEHKQTGYDDNAELDFRYFTILKWLNRKNINQVDNHTIKLPTRSGTLLTQEELDSALQFPKRYYEYFRAGEPSRKTNPEKVGSIWLNTKDTKLWRCIDNTKDDNVWECEDGRQIGSVEKLRYPIPGERGFGVGPMSVDLHEQYGITPLDGCFDSMHPNYGNYMDNNGNILVCIPRHYVKYDSSVNQLMDGEETTTLDKVSITLDKESPLTMKLGSTETVKITTDGEDFDYIALNEEIVSVEKTENTPFAITITPLKVGTTSIIVTAQKEGYLEGITLLDVNVEEKEEETDITE